MELSTNEFTGGYFKTSFSNNVSIQEYQADTRKSYIQAVDSFSLILLPHFDKTMLEDFKSFETQKEELVKELGGKKIGLIFTFKEDSKLKYDSKKVYERSLLELSFFLFEKLNLLLRRVDYLKSAVFGEEASDDIIDDEEEEK